MCADNLTLLPRHNLSAMAFETWLYNQGVGDVLELPMLYMFKYLNTEEVRDLIYDLFQVNALGDNQLLYNRALAELGSGVLLSSNVTSIRRKQKGVEVTVSTPSGKTVIKASKLVIAIPPLLANLEPFLDLCDDESDLFGRFFYDYYWDAILKDSGIPDNTTVINVDPTAPYGIPPTNPGIYTFGSTGFPGLHTVYYSSEFYISDAAVQADILQTTAKLVKSLGYPSVNGTPEFVGFNSREYDQDLGSSIADIIRFCSRCAFRASSVHRGHHERLLREARGSARAARYVVYWSSVGDSELSCHLELHGDERSTEACSLAWVSRRRMQFAESSSHIFTCRDEHVVTLSCTQTSDPGQIDHRDVGEQGYRLKFRWLDQ